MTLESMRYLLTPRSLILLKMTVSVLDYILRYMSYISVCAWCVWEYKHMWDVDMCEGHIWDVWRSRQLKRNGFFAWGSQELNSGHQPWHNSLTGPEISFYFFYINWFIYWGGNMWVRVQQSGVHSFYHVNLYQIIKLCILR